MSVTRSVAVFVGSLRKTSFSRKLAEHLVANAPEPLRLHIVEIGDLPLYDPDLEANLPAPWATLRERLHAADAVLFVTPEYNRSVPGVLKNAIDVGSRPAGKSSWLGKPAAVASLSQGALGGFGANHHLRQSLVFLDMPTMQMPEVYLGNVAKLFDDGGQLANDDTRAFLAKFLAAFAAWIEATAKR